MPQKPPVAPHNATATYVCDSDPTRTRTYPFREGADIPRSVTFEGRTFSLRAVMYSTSDDTKRAA